MIKFGIIGTSKISDKFVEAVNQNKESEIVAVYSRSKNKGQEFIMKNKIKANLYMDLNEMLKDNNVDAVYIASPHSLHSEQSYLCIENKKHVLCEKPISTDLESYEKNIEMAIKNQVTYMEAMKTTFLPNFKVVRENLDKIGPIRYVNLNYSQYSSRYDDLKNGNLTNAFNPEFCGGSSFDIGIYPLYVALKLFGSPDSYIGKNVFLSSGVDGCGTITLNYKDKLVQIAHSKITESVVPNEILGEKGSLVIEGISIMKKIELIYRNGEKKEISITQKENDMEYELEEFIDLLKNKKIESDINTFKLSKKSIEILSKLRV